LYSYWVAAAPGSGAVGAPKTPSALSMLQQRNALAAASATTPRTVFDRLPPIV
jgi:hypothetical protein